MNTRENPYVMDEAEISRRRDLRNSHLIFSIDPKGCEDVDDTLSVRQVETNFVRPQRVCVKWAAPRSS